MTHYTSVLLFTAVLLLSACTKYLPKPLYPEQEWRQLQDVRLDDLLAKVVPDNSANEIVNIAVLNQYNCFTNNPP